MKDGEERVAAVYRDHHKRMWRALFSFAGDPDIASDAMAEAFARALRDQSTIRDLTAWTWRVAFRIAASELRRRHTATATFADTSYELPESPLTSRRITTESLRMSPTGRATYTPGPEVAYAIWPSVASHTTNLDCTNETQRSTGPCMSQGRVRSVLMELLSAHLLTPMRQDDEHADRLRRAADELAAANQMFLAGYVASQAAHVTWGDRPKMETCLGEAFGYLSRATETEPRSSLEAIAALKWWSNQASLFAELAGPDAPGYRALREEMAQRTAIVGRTSENEEARNGFLIRGVVLHVDLDGDWLASFPDREVHGSTSTYGEGFSFEVESCFRVAIYSGDYFAANEFAELAPRSFTTPSLRGWRFAVQGLLDPEHAVESFAAASEQFAQDVLDPDSQQPWSSINVDLWARYFSARSLVAQISREPTALREQVELAREALAGTESGWVDSQVTCFRVLLDAVLRVVTEQPVPSFADLQKDLDWAAHADGDDVSEVTREFLGLLQNGLQEAAEAPQRAFVSGTIRRAVDALRRVPLFDEQVQVQVSDAIGERAVSLVFEQQQTWIHRTLESIRDERDLHRIILRLLQASFPHYAQVRHGPLEYGKDVVAVTDDGSELRLEMYQAKVGDISLPRWREIKPQLEEMFEVDVRKLQLSVTPQHRVGFLVFNGHIQPQAEEAVDGWRVERGLDFRVMHIDGIANWIVTRRLVGDFRGALRELGIPEIT